MRNLNRRLTVAAAGLALAVAASASASAYQAATNGAVNVRSGPGVRYEVLFTLRAGALVEVSGCQGSWCAIDFAGGTAWVSSGYLQPAGYFRTFRPRHETGFNEDRFREAPLPYWARHPWWSNQ